MYSKTLFTSVMKKLMLNVFTTSIMTIINVEIELSTSVLAKTDVVKTLSTLVLDQPMLFFVLFSKIFICFYSEPTRTNLQKYINFILI